MGLIKGQREYEKHQAGAKLSRKQVILAMCYSCNGFEDSAHDCQATTCPLYPYHPHKGKKSSLKPE